MERSPAYYIENIKEIISYHLGKQIIVEEVQMAHIEYLEAPEDEDQELVA